MKNFLFILIPLLILEINNCFAQKDTAATRKFDRFYISLSGGIGIPVGEFTEYKPYGDPTFAIDTTYHSKAGEPRTGITGKLSGYYFFSPYIGCTGSFFTAAFRGKDKTIDESPFLVLYPGETQNFSYHTESWTTSGFLIGIVVNAPLKKINPGLKILGGLQRSVSPETNVSSSSSHDDISYTSNFTQSSASSTNFAWDVGLDIRIKAYKKLNIILSGDYIYSHATFSGNYRTEITLIDHSVSNPPINISNNPAFQYERQISYYSITAGIAYVFK